MSDTAAGARNFGKITAVDNGTKIVTVANAFGFTNTDAWAIGGKRASIGSTTSLKLFSNNSAAGDAMPGWIVEMESGHAETIAANYVLRRAGDQTSGPIILRGTSGAATPPIITFSNNGDGLTPFASYLTICDFELRNSNATKTASRGIVISAASLGLTVKSVKVSHSTNLFWKCVATATNVSAAIIRDCDLGYAANVGIDAAAGSYIEIVNCWIHHCTSHGVSQNTSVAIRAAIRKCAIAYNGGDGIRQMAAGSTATRRLEIIECTIHGNTGDGIEFLSASTDTGMNGTVVESCHLTKNGGYGINFSGASMTDACLQSLGVNLRNNNHSGNTSGFTNPAVTFDENTTNTNPSDSALAAANDYANAAGGSNFAVNSTSKAKGYPLGGTLPVGGSQGTTTYSYVDQGAAQRQESSTSSSLPVVKTKYNEGFN